MSFLALSPFPNLSHLLLRHLIVPTSLNPRLSCGEYISPPMDMYVQFTKSMSIINVLKLGHFAIRKKTTFFSSLHIKEKYFGREKGFTASIVNAAKSSIKKTKWNVNQYLHDMERELAQSCAGPGGWWILLELQCMGLDLTYRFSTAQCLQLVRIKAWG